MIRTEQVDYIFDDTDPQALVFVEAENTKTRASLRTGEWVKRDDGYLALRVQVVVPND